MADADRDRLIADLTHLAGTVARCRLALDVAGVDGARAERDELADQIVDYLVPRLGRLDAPLLAVVGGPTGSGKSTLVNTLVGREVSPAGVLRPTTRAPVLVCHRDDVGWFLEDRLLPGLPRATGQGQPEAGAVLHLRPVDELAPGVAVLDAPDFDSVEEANRELATQLLAAADLWLFVTTAVRYADAVPWEYLGRARDRGTALAVVVNRIPPGAAGEIEADVRRLLAQAGLGSVPLFTVPQLPLVDSRLPAAAAAGPAELLGDLARDTQQRAAVVRRTLSGALASVTPRAGRLVEAVAAQERAAAELRREVDTAYGRARALVAEGLGSGAMLRAEVLQRWQELIGTAELMRALQSRISRLRDRVTGFVTGRLAATEEVAVEITSRLARLVVDLADRAALDVVTAWRSHPAGAALVAEVGDLDRASAALRSEVEAELRAWQGAVLELVRARGRDKRTTARVLALGVNSVGVALMVVLFSSTGGLTGGEVAVASGTATVSQALLTALFGEQAVRELAEEARADLLARVDRLFAAEAGRFAHRLAEAVGDSPPAGEVADAARAVERAGGAW
jgi:energy-coupling factor transporter ATP-binding protein EcfA2